mgnify:CR=1 FL=1
MLFRSAAISRTGRRPSEKFLSGQLLSHFGAAAGAGRMLRLSLPAMESALGLAMMQMSGSRQIVLSGDPPAKARVRVLATAGAFHTHYMAPAVETLRSAVAAVTPSDPGLQLWTNRDGSLVSSGAEALSLVVDQVASPVRWDACMQSFAAAGVTGLIEFAPGGTLVGLAKRALRGVPSVAVKTPEDLTSAAELLATASAQGEAE